MSNYTDLMSDGGMDPRDRSAAVSTRKAKLTELVDRALLAAGTTGERQVWFTRPEAASAVRKTLTDAETVYAARALKWREYGEGMHQRAMRAEAALRAIGDFAHDKSAGPAVPDALWEVRSMAYDAGKP